MPEIRLDGESLLKCIEVIEAQLNQIRRMAAMSRAPAPSAQGIDLTMIEWRGKGSVIVPASVKWAWAFAYEQEGTYKPESKALVQRIEQYGKVEMDGYEMTLGGRDNRLLNRKKQK